MPPHCWPLLREFLYGLPDQDMTTLNLKQITLRLTYRLGTAAPLDNLASIFSPSLAEREAELYRETTKSLQWEAPDGNSSEADRKAYMERSRAALEEYRQMMRKRQEERMHSLLKSYASYEEMERKQDPGQRVVVLWLFASSADGEIDTYIVCLPLALAEDRRDRTQIEILP
jgi:hypothetical protein